MKKLIAIMSIVAGVTSICGAQGYVFFVNSAAAATHISTNSAVGGIATGQTTAYTSLANAYYYALFSSAAATTVGGTTGGALGTNGVYAFNDSANWTAVGVNGGYATNYTLGRMQPAGPLNADSSTSIANPSAGGTAQFLVIGWSGNIGTTWQNVQSYLANPTVVGWVGESLVSGVQTLGNGGSIAPSNVFGSAAPFIGGFTMGQVAPSVVPEPGTLALAALGGASLLMFRRKK